MISDKWGGVSRDSLVSRIFLCNFVAEYDGVFWVNPGCAMIGRLYNLKRHIL